MRPIKTENVQRNLFKITAALANPNDDEATVTEGVMALLIAAALIETRYGIKITDEMLRPYTAVIV